MNCNEHSNLNNDAPEKEVNLENLLLKELIDITRICPDPIDVIYLKSFMKDYIEHTVMKSMLKRMQDITTVEELEYQLACRLFTDGKIGNALEIVKKSEHPLAVGARRQIINTVKAQELPD